MGWQSFVAAQEGLDEQPGLLAVYQSLVAGEASLARIEAKPALFLDEGSLHPRLPLGLFTVSWQGWLRLEEAPPVRFSAHLRGAVTVEVDGRVVLEGQGDSLASRIASTTALALEPGTYSILIRYQSPADLPARLQLWWEGDDFSPEPLPPWRLVHRPAALPPTVLEEERGAKGRRIALELGCARCHASAFPGLEAQLPGPSLAGLGERVQRDWLLRWLGSPASTRPGARMPELFTADRAGFVERWILAEFLAADATTAGVVSPAGAGGDHRMGRRHFLGLGCAACHFAPDADRAVEPDLERIAFQGLADRFSSSHLATFLQAPSSRYADQRMPTLPLTSEAAQDIAAYLLLWSKASDLHSPEEAPPTPEELAGVSRRFGAKDRASTVRALLRERRCTSCHAGLEGEVAPGVAVDVSKRSDASVTGNVCGDGVMAPRFHLDGQVREALAAYLRLAPLEVHPSPSAGRRLLLERAGCRRCHQRDTDRPPPVEQVGAISGGAWLQVLPFQRTPRLTGATEKLTASYLLAAVRDGVSGLRGSSYTYRMPAFGDLAPALVRALAEADGAVPEAVDTVSTELAAADPTLGSLAGVDLVGFRGMACISCHVWNGRMFSSPDPGAIGPDLMRTVERIRRPWLDRFLEAPARVHPNTPMPAFFPRGVTKGLRHVLDGDIARQKEALWSYLALGKEAPSPRPSPPIEIPSPLAGESVLVAQVPLRLPGDNLIDSLCILSSSHDLVVYDLALSQLRAVYTGATVERGVSGRVRTYRVEGTAVDMPPLVASKHEFRGYERLRDGVRIRLRTQGENAGREIIETYRLVGAGAARELERVVEGAGQRTASSLPLPPAGKPRRDSQEAVAFTDPARPEGELERPGYRAIAYPRPKTPTGEDLVMPSAVAVDAPSGRVFVASMRRGEVFVLDDPALDGKSARFIDYTRGLFQEAYSLLAADGALYILHRRSLTRATDTDADGLADRFDRVALFPQGIADDYDYAYGLVRDKTGAFVMTHAPHGNHHIPGSGSALRFRVDETPQAIGFGFRNPLGWCIGNEGEVFFTDNQGEWVATNKLCHLVEGRFHGYPNSAQKEHALKPAGKAAVWVPYAWAKSINGVTFDATGGKFGPFAGQFFLAELMYGGAIVRASLERVQGELQGVCFPFWGKGLLGPVVLAFGPQGSLYVGSITEPGWMAQPDRGALFRLDWTGDMPFEMQTIRILPGGFRIVLTRPAAGESARDLASYQIERYRYEYTGAYGSPELDRREEKLQRVELAPDNLSIDLTLGELHKDHVYRLGAPGLRSEQGESLVQPVGAYTVNEVP